MTTQPTPRRVQRQLVGRRLGREPYYTIISQEEGRLVLQSNPDANTPMGNKVLRRGIIFLVLAVFLVVVGFMGTAQGAGIGPLLVTVAIAGLLGGLGLTRAVGGYAIRTTQNRIEADADTGTLRFSQQSKVGKVREQTVEFARISAVRLSQRRLLSDAARATQIVALELLVDGESVWVVDSAEQAGPLLPTAQALAELLGRELQGGG
ncbi:MAG: hypothetical protein MUD01_12830 [Chloroflexaceae bacterium]|jgi:hypothetical protein|nr:hypothetical protein [Chloroflexaceae bacterium]